MPYGQPTEMHMPIGLELLYDEIKYAGFQFSIYWEIDGQKYKHVYMRPDTDSNTTNRTDDLPAEEQTTPENFARFIENIISTYKISAICLDINFECYANRDGTEVEYNTNSKSIGYK